MTKPKLELTRIGKETRPRLESRILIEDPVKSHHAAHRVTDNDLFNNKLIFGDNLLAKNTLEYSIRKSGWMQVEVMTRLSKHETEEILIVGALTDDGTVLYPDVAQKLFQLPAESRPLAEGIPPQLQAVTDIQRRRKAEEAQQRQQSYFSTEIDKLDLSAEDLKNGLELRIKELEVSIKETKKASTMAITLEDKLDLQKKVKDLDAERNQARKRLFDAQDEIDAKRDEIINEIERQLSTSLDSKNRMTIHWKLEG